MKYLLSLLFLLCSCCLNYDYAILYTRAKYTSKWAEIDRQFEENIRKSVQQPVQMGYCAMQYNLLVCPADAKSVKVNGMLLYSPSRSKETWLPPRPSLTGPMTVSDDCVNKDSDCDFDLDLKDWAFYQNNFGNGNWFPCFEDINPCFFYKGSCSTY